MRRSRLRNIINKSKEYSIGAFELFKKSLPIEIDDNYRLEAAWKAYGSPKNYKEAVWQGLIQPIDEGNIKLPSIGYNKETDEYEYLNSGKDNETVAKDIRVWDNDVIPLVQELKLGGYVRTFSEEKNCWTYSKNSLKGTESSEDNKLQVIDSFQQGGNFKLDTGEWINNEYVIPDEQLTTLHPGAWDNYVKQWNEFFKNNPNRHKFVLRSKNGVLKHTLPMTMDLRENSNLKQPTHVEEPNSVYVLKPIMFLQGGKSEYKKVKSDKAHYDKETDTVYYTNDEDLVHEGFHARPDSVLLEQLKPYYENLNDEKILNFGGNLLFVKRFEGDPGHFYSPEELGARISAAKFRTKGNNYTPEFFKYLRTNENLYGDNMRDLLYMYNDENLSKIFNIGNTQAFKQGGQMNVIPEGALHARKNGMELAKEGEVTHKGIPVVDNDGNQQAEIERNEIIFNKEVTEKLENYYKQYNSDEKSQSEKDEIAIKAGKLLAKLIIENTDDRTGLIEEVANKQ